MAEEAESEEAENAEESEEGAEDSEESGSKKKISGKKIVLFVVAPLLLIAIGGGAAFFLGFFGGGEEELAEEGGEAEAPLPEEFVFYDLPEMLVNLNTNGNGATYLKLSVAIELDEAEQIGLIEPLMPRVVDRFQVYLRQLRVADLSGSAGMFHLKTELMRRINASVPIEVKDVLFKEMIIQ